MMLQQHALFTICVRLMVNTSMKPGSKILKMSNNQPVTVGVRDRSGDRQKHVREALVEYIRSKQNQ